jgi:cytochrome c peroxidase
MKSMAAIGAISLSIVSFSACGGGPDGDVLGEQTEALQADQPMTAAMKDATGIIRTFSTTGSVDGTNAFFQSLGTNGRACVTCHRPEDAWTVVPAHVQARFDATRPAGIDPIFRTNDGSNSPLADTSTVAARRKAYSMLLAKGVIRVGLPIPPAAEFELAAVDDPYHFASAAELSLFRRPLPTTNLAFLSTVMWDARETFKDASSTTCIKGTTNCFASINFDLLDQANAATLGHAQAATALTPEQRQSIVNLEMSLFTAQTVDDDAKRLDTAHANGGPEKLSQQSFYFGINDVVSGDYQTSAPFNPNVFDLYAYWGRPGGDTDALDKDDDDASPTRTEARREVARGETLFNTLPIAITGVAGLNDDLGIATLNGTCTTCHDTPRSGNHSIPAPLNIGLTDASRRTPDLPLYTLRNLATGQTVQTTDPGRALLTGKWKDIGRFRGPILRALAARAPYFHNGFAASLDEVVEFYDTRFALALTTANKSALVAFLRTL